LGRTAFCDELAMVVNAWIRSGDKVSMSKTGEFLEEVFRNVLAENQWGRKIMDLLENQSSQVKCIIRENEDDQHQLVS
jgi:hypothetical protein